MGAPVIKEFCEVDKGLSTWTRMQGIWGVSSPVRQEEGLRAKGQTTVHTGKMRLAAVVSKVLIQTRRAGEDTAAQGTLKDTLPVTSQVLL